MGNTRAETIARTRQSTFPVWEFKVKVANRRYLISSEPTLML